jgi:hypothetical protein
MPREYINVYLTADAPASWAMSRDDVPTMQGVRNPNGDRAFDMNYRQALALLRKLHAMGLTAIAVNDGDNIVASTTTIEEA